jgi:hypothetical protein
MGGLLSVPGSLPGGKNLKDFARRVNLPNSSLVQKKR